MSTTSVEVTAGLGGFLVLFALALAVWFLGRDLTRRLRRMNRAEETRVAAQTPPPEVPGPGGAAGEEPGAAEVAGPGEAAASDVEAGDERGDDGVPGDGVPPRTGERGDDGVPPRTGA